MKIELNYQNRVVCLPGAVLEKNDATEQDLRVLLKLAGRPDLQECFDAAKLAVELEIPEREVENAVSFWRGAGILRTSRSASAKPTGGEKQEKTPLPITGTSGMPSYTGKQIEEIMAERKRLGQLLEECQKILDRVFNVSESNMVIALCDVMHLEDDYILLLCSYCTGKSEKGVTMKYVYNTAYRLYEQNILTMQGLEDYIAKEESARDFENRVRHLFGIGGRKLTAREKKFFENWRALGFTNEVFSYGYELSVDATGELSYPHLNKILEGWKKAGVKDLEDARKNAEEHREAMRKLYGDKKAETSGKQKKPEEFSSFDPDEFFEKAKQKGKEVLKGKT